MLEITRERAAMCALMACVDVGVPEEAIAFAVDQNDPMDDAVLAKLRADFKQGVGAFIEKQVRECVCLVQTASDNQAIREFQERRRAIIRRFRQDGVETIWNRALHLVNTNPERALDIYEEGGERSGICSAGLIQFLLGKSRGLERRYATIKIRVNSMVKDLERNQIPEGELTAKDAGVVGYLAAKQFGGGRTLLVSVVAHAIMAAVGYHIALLITDDPARYKRMVHENIDSGDFDELRTATQEASTLPLWAELFSLVEVLGRSDFADWPAIAGPLLEANGMASRLRDELEVAAKAGRRQQAAADKESAALLKRMKALERDLEDARKRAASASQAPAAAVTPGQTPSAQDGELAELRRANARLQRQVTDQEAQLSNTRALLDSVISQPAIATAGQPPMTEQEFRNLKGVVIGGHENMVSKLRKAMPKCMFYSSDHKKIDEAAVRDRDFMIFFTSHCNHCLSDNALRLSRLYDIPTGYSGHVNVDMFLADVAAILGRRTV